MVWSGKTLEALMDIVQIFGSVSLFEAAQNMWAIASQIREAYVGVAFLWSFFTISILHTVAAILEVFEGEYQRNWAVLGLNWTVNLNGLLLFVNSTRAVGNTSLPWLTMIAPAIQTMVLVYALKTLGGWSGGIRMALVVTNIGMLVVLLVYTDLTTDITRLCTDITLVEEGGKMIMFLPDDCPTANSLKVAGVIVTDEDPINFESGGILRAIIGIAGSVIAVVGGSFVSLIVASRFKDDAPHAVLTKAGKVWKIIIVCAWVVAYPCFEFVRVCAKLLDWLKSLHGSLKGGKYKFSLDGKISHE